MSDIKIAVYGSLRKGFHNHGLLENEHCEFIDFARTKPQYTLFPISGFPGIKKNGTTSVLVEVYKVNKEYLPTIDLLEGYREGREATFYDRKKISVEYRNGEEGEVFIYEYVPNSNQPVIETGDWADNFKQKERL
jgi:gamma-glutamylcyclotransferase (GGCT)/AIG2-like uncharacterized protein YtfP